MKKRKRIWMISMVLAITAAHGTILAEAQETEGSVEAITQTTEDGTELDTKILMETVKEHIDLPKETEQVSGCKPTEDAVKKSSVQQVKQVQKPVKKTANGQTLLDVSKGNITIKSSGATGGGYIFKPSGLPDYRKNHFILYKSRSRSHDRYYIGQCQCHQQQRQQKLHGCVSCQCDNYIGREQHAFLWYTELWGFSERRHG